MDKYKIELLPSAWAELDEIADMYMELVGVKSAQRITDKILNQLDLLSDNPFMGGIPKYQWLAEQGFRVLVCEKYLCFYKVSETIVEVYHIVDGRRDYPNLIF